ncbi:MAG: dienelactone hydrolase family protein [Micavibrio aeruginosavorus]|uniref:Dienelactone hydrolase family protein n=1 Tax=Micavibrio aeruginosavorus TaxID=349221 RepID=A0A7T5UHW8_9BACT|nr:MAG: dienelactone hydrolase family protein [Micavibrio aeruginosavorus]
MTVQNIPASDGQSFAAYTALPAKTPAPVIILIQEIFGVNAEMRAKCDSLAQRGFIAVCPDLFWRMEPGIQLTDKTEEEWVRAFGFYQRFDVEKGIEDLRATLHTFRGHALGNGKIGVMGYCLGGKLAYLMAARSRADCSIGYYGVGIEDLLDESRHIKNPLMLHIAEEDKYVSKGAQKKILQALTGNPLITIHTYPDMDHAFARGGGQHYNETAAQTANQRTLDFLDRHLRRSVAA